MMNGKNEKEFVLYSRKDQLNLSVVMVTPEEHTEIKGVFQISHGMCENKERYLPFMHFLADHGFISVIHDHRGHGKSVRSREDLGYMYKGGSSALIDDILVVNEWIRKEYPGKKVVLFGHSMGSLAVRAFTRLYDDVVDALIVCGSPSKNPARAVGSSIAKIEGKIFGAKHPGKLLEKMAFGPYQAAFKGETSAFCWLCSDSEVVRAYEDSEFCGFTFTDDAYIVLFDLMKYAYAEKGWKCSKPDLPILFIGGAEDPCIGGPAAFHKALTAMRMAGYKDVKGHLYQKMRHEILNEPEKEKVYRDICAFLEKKGV